MFREVPYQLPRNAALITLVNFPIDLLDDLSNIEIVFGAGGSCWAGSSSGTSGAFITLVTFGTGRSSGAFITLVTFRAGRSSGAFITLVTFGTGRSSGACRTMCACGPRWSSRADGPQC